MHVIRFFGSFVLSALLVSLPGVSGGPVDSSMRSLEARAWKIDVMKFAPGEGVHCGLDEKTISCSAARDHCKNLPDAPFDFKLAHKNQSVGKDGGIQLRAYRAGHKGKTLGSQRKKCSEIVDTCCKKGADTMTAGFVGWDKSSTTKGGGFILSSA